MNCVTSEVNYITQDYPYLNLLVPALYLETLAISRGRETASSQRFSYFGSLAEGEGGDGACVEYINNAMSFLLLLIIEDLVSMKHLHHLHDQRNPFLTSCTDEEKKHRSLTVRIALRITPASLIIIA